MPHLKRFFEGQFPSDSGKGVVAAVFDRTTGKPVLWMAPMGLEAFAKLLNEFEERVQQTENFAGLKAPRR